MPRQPSINRTLPVTHVIMLCMDTVAAEPINESAIVPGLFRDQPEKLFKTAAKLIDTPEIKSVSIVESHESMVHFKMPLTKYVETAEVIESFPIGMK